MQIPLKASVVPLLQATLTCFATLTGVLLALQAPNRSRFFPFYSDASHKDPSRVILCLLENLACFFTPLTATLEYLHHGSLARKLYHPALTRLKHQQVLENHFQKQASAPTHPLTLSSVIRLYYMCGLTIVAARFITANVPSWPLLFSPVHQVAASSLLFLFATLSTLKVHLADIFDNYKTTSRDPSCTSWLSTCWSRIHRPVRRAIAGALWILLLATFSAHFGRKLLPSRNPQYTRTRELLLRIIALVIYAATLLCIVFMIIVAIDMRNAKVIIQLESDHFDKNSLHTPRLRNGTQVLEP